jgi:hypothetical protein
MQADASGTGRLPLERCDIALLAAFVLNAGLGTWNNCLLVNDGTFLLSVGWLGDAWHLYFKQIAERSVSTLVAFGPAWAARWAFGLSSSAYMTLAHLLYFGALLVLWLVIRLVEPHRIYSRLYISIALALAYFPTEYLVGIGFWMVWMALIADPARSSRSAIVLTICFAPILAFAHPANAFASMIYVLVGGALTLSGRSFPRQTLLPAAAMAIFVLVTYFVTAATFPASNPTIAALNAKAKYDYVNPTYLLDTLRIFPMLASLWALLVIPGLQNIGLRRNYSTVVVAAAGVFGLWFAANGTSLLTFLFARHTAIHVMGLALALAVTAPATMWLEQARRPLLLYATILAVAGISYNVDLLLFGRFVDEHLTPGIVDVDKLPPSIWPRQQARTWPSRRTYFKWTAGRDYVRDVVVPDYQQYQHSLAFYSFFRSDRRSVLFHHIPGRYWLPFRCGPIGNALVHTRDDLDRQFLSFLSENYCVR